jgi:uncharacterized protein (TIGR03066 family)
MKRTSKHSLKAGKPKPPPQAALNLLSKTAKPPSSQPNTGSADKWSFKRMVLFSLCVVLAGGVTWAAFEFVIWRKVPTELVGKWVVEGGSQDGATFDFSRRGGLESHLNKGGNDQILEGRVTVVDKTMSITTRNPYTGQNDTKTCQIRELTEKTLVVEFPNGEVFRMARAQ